MRSLIFEDKASGLKAYLNNEIAVPNSNNPLLEIEDATGRSEFFRDDDAVETKIADCQDVSAAAVKARLLELESENPTVESPEDSAARTRALVDSITRPKTEPDEWLENATRAIDEAYEGMFGDKPPQAD